jgi:multidrug resistance efflux pump
MPNEITPHRRTAAAVTAVTLMVLALGLGAYVVASGDDVSDVEPVVATGTLDADETALSAEVTGRISEVLVTEGEEVSSDQVLFRIDASELSAQRLHALAAVRDAEAALALALAGPRPQELGRARAAVGEAQQSLNQLIAGARPEEVLQGQGELQAARAALEHARREYERVKGLVASGDVAQQRLDVAEAAYHSADGRYQVAAQQLALVTAGPRVEETSGARERLRQAQASYELLVAGTRSEEITAARARVEQARAALTMSDLRLADAEVKAPSGAVVARLIAKTGEVVRPGEPLAMLVGGHPWVDLHIDESDAAQVSVGLPVDLTVRAYPGATFPARVVSINETLVGEQQTKDSMSLRTLRVRVRTEGTPSRPLRPGMSVQAAILPAGGR